MAKKILLVDDDDFIREYAAKALKRKGAEIIETASGIEAVKLYKAHKPNCVFLDIGLPDMSGLDVLARVMAHDKSAKVYIVSGTNGGRTRGRALELGAQQFIDKPVSVDILWAIVEAL